MENSIICSKNPNIVWISEKLIEDRFDANPFKVQYIEDDIKDTEVYRCRIINDILRSKKDLTGGATPLGASYLDKGIRFIRTQDVDYNWINVDESVYISDEDDKKLKRSSLEVDDILLTITGVNFGKSAPVRRECLPANISQHSVRMHFKNEIDPYYVSTFLNSIYGQKQIMKKSVGATRPAIDYPNIKNIKVACPTYEIQKYIGDKVRKAEELRKEAKKLENEAYKEFNNLFDFKVNKENIWILNPTNLVDRIDCEYNYDYFFELEKKLSKNGVLVQKFGALIAKKMSEPQTDSADFTDVGIPVLRITDIHENYLDFKNCAKISEKVYDKLKEFQLIPKDIIFGLSGTIGRAIVVPNKIPEKAITNRRIAKVTLKQAELAYYIAMFLNSEYGKMQLIRETTGGVQKNLRLEDITRVHIPIPDKKIIDKISNYIENSMMCLNRSRLLIQEAKEDIEDLIEGNFDMSKIKESNKR